jgi:hypothetical protein
VAFPAGIWSLTIAVTLFAITLTFAAVLRRGV